jgi:hypothetical protein
MKLFLLKLICLFLIIIFATGGLKFLLPTKKNYNSAFVDKLELLQKNKTNRKILLIGGSSVGWGISAEQIQKATNIITINLGHHAGFGLIDFQQFILSCLTPEDLIIFSPEWLFFDNPNAYDTATLNNLLQNMTYLELTNKPIITKVKSIYLKKISLNQKKDKINPYTYDCLNQNGDIISHCGLIPKSPIKYSVDFTNFDLNSFIKTFKYMSSVKCVLLFPPTQESIFLDNIKSFEKLQGILSKNNVNIMDSITSIIYHESNFFDESII